MLKMRLALPDVARSPHARVPRGLGEGAFNATTRLIHVMEFGRLLTGPSGQEHLVALGGKRTVMLRPVACALVHCARSGQAWQVD